MKSDYEKLKEQGYTEEEIKVALDGLSSVNIAESPMGKDRQDKAVSLSDKDGRTMDTSSIMMGYNKKGIILPDGQYVSSVEVIDAIKNTLSKDEENKVIVCKKTGKKVDASNLTEEVMTTLRGQGEILISGPSSKITNQETAGISVKGKDDNKFVPKGVLMLGNGKIQLPSGEYISFQELQAALNDYVYLKKEEVMPVGITPNPVQPEVRKVVKRSKTTWKLWPILAAIILILISMIRIHRPDIKVSDINETTVTSTYDVSSLTEENIYETAEQIANRIASQYTTGGTVNVQEGVKYHSSSDYETNPASKSGTFGEGLRQAGEYNVDYISVLHQGKIIETKFETGQNVADVINEVSQKLNVSPSELNVKLHIGGPVSGWVDMNDLQNKDNLSPQVVGSNVVVDSDYKGVEENFNGIIHLQTENGIVTLNVLDGSGNILPSSSIVKGSDGQEYRISSLNVEQNTITKTEEHKTSWKVSWSVHNLNKELALLTAAAALASILLTKEKKEKTEKVTEEEYRKLLSEYKEKYDSKSAFVKIINKLRGKEPNWERINIMLQNGEITVDQISEMYDSRGMKR